MIAVNTGSCEGVGAERCVLTMGAGRKMLHQATRECLEVIGRSLSCSFVIEEGLHRGLDGLKQHTSDSGSILTGGALLEMTFLLGGELQRDCHNETPQSGG